MEKECVCATVDIEKVVVRKKGAKHNSLWSLYGKSTTSSPSGNEGPIVLNYNNFFRVLGCGGPFRFPDLTQFD